MKYRGNIMGKNNFKDFGKNIEKLGKNIERNVKPAMDMVGDAAKDVVHKVEKTTKHATKSIEKEVDKKRKSRTALDEELKKAITEYNKVYSSINDHGTKLFNQRERAINLLGNVENLVNSIANHPKEFDADIKEISVEKKRFRDVCDFAKKELAEAQKSAQGVGAGVAGGAAVAAMAPTAAMWVATTFGTASTGTAISALSGAAATKAALAWLGGGAIAAGGGGIVAGEALLALAGPIGWSIAGATLLTSIVLFQNKKMKLDKEKKEEIKSVYENVKQLEKTDAKILALLKKTDKLRNSLSEYYTKCMRFFNTDFMSLSENEQMELGTLVNDAKALAASLGKGV